MTPLDDPALKAETRRVEQLEGCDKVAGVGIVLVCMPALPRSVDCGWVNGRVEENEDGAHGSTLFDLCSCKAE